QLLSSLICLFSFYSCGCHSVLHSFPTRRSSDLLRDQLRAAGDDSRLRAAEQLVAAERDQVHSLFEHLRGRRLVLAAAEGGSVERDRKSTRLNSSHLGISYAVFCLKKKML